MRLRPRLLLVPLLLALGACGPDLGRMELVQPVDGGMPPQLTQAIRIGEVSGGAKTMNGVDASEFKKVLKDVLRANGLLSPDASAARYTLDASLSFAIGGKNGTFTAQRIDAEVSYRLSETAQLTPALQRTIKTSYVQPAPRPGMQVAVFLLAGAGGLLGDQQVREEFAYEGAVRQNVQELLCALSDFGASPKKAGEASAPTPLCPAAATPKAPAGNVTASAAPSPAKPPHAAAPATSATAVAAATPTAADQVAALLPQKPAAPSAPAQSSAVTPAAPAQLFGDEVQFRCPGPGTEIDFRSGFTRVFSPPGHARAPDCAYSVANGVAQATAFGAYASRAAQQALRRLWPLRIGNQVSFATEVSFGRVYNERYRVVRHELVTVPAGTFDAFVIDWDGTSADQYANGYHETASFWYAPALGYVVKVEHHLLGGIYARLTDDEAVRVVSR
ncbi:MAG TPA: hypothetical protein VN668_17620 [Stellaceae bacterium]|nr:hypothetical protein [Stellaceae bacterium]